MVQGRNKGTDGSGRYIGTGFMLYLSILRCDNSIIKFLGEIRPFGGLVIW